MKILMRNQHEKNWQLIQSAAYANETELQKLLAEQPSLISVEEAREGAGNLVAAVREFPLEVGYIDLVGFTADGDIAVVECKLAASEEIKRKVIGQVFEYGANLWGMSYDELDQKVQQRAGKSLADLVRERVDDPEWDEETFRSSVESALQTGDFILIIVVDEINEGLSRIVRFINVAGKPAFTLAALEMRRFQKDHTEILVPHLFGTVSAAKKEQDGQRTRWTEQRFFEVARANLKTDVVDIMQDIYQWSETNASQIWFGNGKVDGSYTFHYHKDGKRLSMFTVYTSGVLSINYGYLTGVSGQLDEATISKFHEALTAIPGFGHIPAEFINRWPSMKVQEVFLGHPERLEQFKAAVEGFKKELAQGA